ncbi:MAG: aminotransferase class I/II-fold pyridoxal phosphate-dependent enzyme [Actinomycetota bacterium]|nr:aminotransferase class I/II-fold pyridoxal phosphate-dependent enzyme [Actinomycetota bacterium]
MHAENLDPASFVVAAGRPARSQGNPVNPPLVLTSTYFSTGVPVPGEPLYARIDNETWHPFEEALGALEKADGPALLFSSGMAAIAAAMSVVPARGRLVIARHAYQVALGFAHDLGERFGVDVRLVDIDDTAAVVAAIGDRADLLWVESPTNPMLEVADLPALIEAAHATGTLVGVDNTFATPLAQRPLELGADLVVHSVTKSLSGHSDVILGALASRTSELRATMHAYRTLHGNIAGPFEAWLALRGLRTLALRVERSQANTLELATRLAEHPDVAEVRFPGLPGDPGHERAAAQMSGFGSLLGMRPRGGIAAADAVTRAVRLWLPATSLGGVESMLERRRRFTTESTTVPEDLVRMSVGIESVEDLWADLDQALRAAHA